MTTQVRPVLLIPQVGRPTGGGAAYNATGGPSGGTPHPRREFLMQITLYLRSYPVAGVPVAVSFAPDPAARRHTFAAGGRVYEAERREVRVSCY